LIKSPAYRVLSRAAHLAMSRIEIEQRHHGGRDNGRLPVTFQDFVDYGIHHSSVTPALRELEAVGIIRVTQRGRAGNAEHRSPNLFFLTFANERDGTKAPPPHDWRKVETIEQAEQLVSAARVAKDPQAVERGRKQAARRRKNRASPTTGFRKVSLPESGVKAENPTTGIR
jgi:DNA-binding transcriptional MocR family regulator